MELKDYKDSNNLSYSELGKKLGISKSRVFNICNKTGGGVRVDEVNTIVGGTEGQVRGSDLGIRKEASA